MLLIFCCIVKWSLYNKIQFPSLLDLLLYISWIYCFIVVFNLKPPSPQKKKKKKFNCFFGYFSKIKSSHMISCFSMISFLFSKLVACFVKEVLILQAISLFNVFFPGSYGWNFYLDGDISGCFSIFIDNMCSQWCKENFIIFHDDFSFLVLRGVYGYIKMM
jgi:hypothetical protein